MSNEVENQGLGPISLDDVRKVVAAADLDPRKTNAGAVRKLLSDRGGMGTIQKHLEALRVELEPKVPELNGDIPVVPKDLAEALWRASWTAAQAHTAQVLAKTLLERDQTRTALAATTADLEALTSDADAAMATATEAQAAAKASRTALDALKDEAATASAKAADKLSETLSNTDSLIKGLEAAYKLKMSHAETQRATLQGQLDRMTDQLAEVKSLLPRYATGTESTPAPGM